MEFRHSLKYGYNPATEVAGHSMPVLLVVMLGAEDISSDLDLDRHYVRDFVIHWICRRGRRSQV
ncbi:hypothetical protein C8Q77DRAFT_1135090 [Trametes polyzona]|nr:hypothetical protein C8Q77DRAFT_1135090 [Trametes polyzona]